MSTNECCCVLLAITWMANLVFIGSYGANQITTFNAYQSIQCQVLNITTFPVPCTVGAQAVPTYPCQCARWQVNYYYGQTTMDQPSAACDGQQTVTAALQWLQGTYGITDINQTVPCLALSAEDQNSRWPSVVLGTHRPVPVAGITVTVVLFTAIPCLWLWYACCLCLCDPDDNDGADGLAPRTPPLRPAHASESESKEETILSKGGIVLPFYPPELRTETV